MLQNTIFAVIFVFIGLAIGLNNQQSPTELLPSPSTSHSDPRIQQLVDKNQLLRARLTSIETRQTEEHAAWKSLADTVDLLKKQISNAAETMRVSTDTSKNSITPTNNFVSPPTNFNPFTNNGTQTLLALGIDETVTERIQQRKEKEEMDRLFLRNSAIREGWFGTEKYFEKTQRMNRATNVYREELGDENYDQYLFKSNQNNRISILSVISSSPAENSGLEKGDVIIHYDQVAIFSWSDLTEATTTGELDQDVSIVVQRNGAKLEFFVPRGPLGIRLENVRLDPDT